jgi:sugar phosphate isomerase/epimerase
MQSIKGPGIFLAQFLDDVAPRDNLPNICNWVADMGYKAIQIPTWDSRVFDLELAASSQDYCDEIKGTAAEAGLEISELSTHLQGQLVAVHPAYDQMFDGFAPDSIRNNPAGRTHWAIQQLKYAAKASQRLGLTAHATFSWGAIVANLLSLGRSGLPGWWRPDLASLPSAGCLFWTHLMKPA